MKVLATNLKTGERMELEVQLPQRLTIEDVRQRYPAANGKLRSRRCIQNWCEERILPFMKIGGAIFFDPKKLDELEQRSEFKSKYLC